MILVASCSLAACRIPVVIFKSKRLTVFKSTFAEAVICAARSRLRFPLISCLAAESLLSLITLKATRLLFILPSRTTNPRFIKFSTVSGLATGMRKHSFSCFFSSVTAASSIAIRFAACSVMKELTTQVTSISRIVPFSTSSFSKRSPEGRIILYPTNTAASVAAA